MQGLFQSIENKVCLGRPRDPPSHDAASECVDDEGGIDNVLLGRDVRKSLTHIKFGAGARNTRFTLSGGHRAGVLGTVVLATHPRAAPRMPICFSRRSTAQRSMQVDDRKLTAQSAAPCRSTRYREQRAEFQ